MAIGPSYTAALARFAAVQGVADGSLGRDEEFDDAFAAILGKLVAQDKLVGPGHRIARLVLTRRVADQEIHPQGRGVVDLVLQLRARLGDRSVLGKIDARRRTGVLRVDAQAYLPVVIGIGFGDDLGRGAFFLRFLGDIPVAEVFPQPPVAGDGLERVQSLWRQPGHAGLLGIAVSHIRPAGLVLVFGPKQILGLVADGIELFLDIQVQLQRVGGQRLFNLLLAVERLGWCPGSCPMPWMPVAEALPARWMGNRTLSNRLRMVEVKSCS